MVNLGTPAEAQTYLDEFGLGSMQHAEDSLDL